MEGSYAVAGGWRLNLRTVVVRADALELRRWLGRPERLDWADLVEVRRVDPETVEVVGVLGSHRLDRRVERFDELVATLDKQADLAAAAREQAAWPRATDIARWLGDFREVDVLQVEPPTWRRWLQGAVAAGLAALLYGRYANTLYFSGRADSQGYTWLRVCLGLGAAFYLAFEWLWSRGARWRARHRLGGDAHVRWLRLRADQAGFALTRDDETVAVLWSELVSVDEIAGELRLRLAHRPPVALPALAEFGPVLRVLRILRRLSV